MSVLLSLTAASMQASAATAAIDGRIVYVKLGDIWVMDADGANQTNLTDTADLDESQPDWSPDGSQIAFTLRSDPGAGGFGDIYVMDDDPATTDAANLTNTPEFNDYQPSWAPSGAQIAFVSERPGEVISEQPDIFVMDADGASPTNVTQTDAMELYPAWSPDGTKIAFSGVRDAGWAILTMDPNGANEQNLTGEQEFDFAPEWSPDSSMLVFMRQSQMGGCCEPWEVWGVNRDGSGDTNLTNHPSDDMGPSWSPDGSEITFSSNRDAAPGESDIYTMPAPTVLPPPAVAVSAAVRRLTTDRSSAEPTGGRRSSR